MKDKMTYTTREVFEIANMHGTLCVDEIIVPKIDGLNRNVDYLRRVLDLIRKYRAEIPSDIREGLFPNRRLNELEAECDRILRKSSMECQVNS